MRMILLASTAALALGACAPQVTRVSEVTQIPRDKVQLCRDYMVATLSATALNPEAVDRLAELKAALIEAGLACLKTVTPPTTAVTAYGVMASTPAVINVEPVEVSPELAGQILETPPAE